MTVQELIDKLNKVEDKTKSIKIAIDWDDDEGVISTSQGLYVNDIDKDFTYILNY